MWPTLFTLASPAGRRARLSVLIFHRVLPEPDPLFPGEVHRQRFDELCAWLRVWFRVLPLDEAVRRLRARELPSRSLAITFDDGYADNHDVALPVLLRHGLTATFFVATGFLDGGRMWNDTVIESVRRTPHGVLELGDLGLAGLSRLPVGTLDEKRSAIAAILAATKYLPPAHRDEMVGLIARRAGAWLPDDLMLRSAQVLRMRRAGMQIGAHTVSHPILARLDDASARDEMLRSKTDLEAVLDEPVTLFAYPNGKPGEDYSPRCVALARGLGFEAAVSTRWGAATAGTDPFELPRFTPWDRRKAAFGLRLLRNLL